MWAAHGWGGDDDGAAGMCDNSLVARKQQRIRRGTTTATTLLYPLLPVNEEPAGRSILDTGGSIVALIDNRAREVSRGGEIS